MYLKCFLFSHLQAESGATMHQYLQTMPLSRLFAICVGGLASCAGSNLIQYMAFGVCFEVWFRHILCLCSLSLMLSQQTFLTIGQYRNKSVISRTLFFFVRSENPFLLDLNVPFLYGIVLFYKTNNRRRFTPVRPSVALKVYEEDGKKRRKLGADASLHLVIFVRNCFIHFNNDRIRHMHGPKELRQFKKYSKTCRWFMLKRQYIVDYRKLG